MLEALAFQGLIMLAAWAVTKFLLEMCGTPMLSKSELEVRHGLRQGNE